MFFYVLVSPVGRLPLVAAKSIFLKQLMWLWGQDSVFRYAQNMSFGELGWNNED